MNSERIAILASLREDLLTFLDELSIILPDDKNLLMMKPFIKIVIMADVANYISKYIAPLKEKVIKRDEKYFLENAVLFEKLQDRASTVNYFKNLWMKTDDPHSKEAVWQWLSHFIEMSERYDKLQ